jgi:hypothetical protein
VPSKTEYLDVIYTSIREINAQLPTEQRLACTPDTVLVGEGGVLDSLGLINLLILVEEGVSARTGSAVTLLNESYIGVQDGPFRTVGALADYIDKQVAG